MPAEQVLLLLSLRSLSGLPCPFIPSLPSPRPPSFLPWVTTWTFWESPALNVQILVPLLHWQDEFLKFIKVYHHLIKILQHVPTATRQNPNFLVWQTKPLINLSKNWVFPWLNFHDCQPPHCSNNTELLAVSWMYYPLLFSTPFKRGVFWVSKVLLSYCVGFINSTPPSIKLRNHLPQGDLVDP